MRLLLDNCMPYRAKAFFPDHTVVHACDIGCEDLTNGALIARAALEFDALVAVDKKMRQEHAPSDLPMAIIELNARYARLADLQAPSDLSRP